MNQSLSLIEHLVVVMFENRSFDNLLGWLYSEAPNIPTYNIPHQLSPTFNGLLPHTYFNILNHQKVFASHPPTSWPLNPNPYTVPTPDPQESFKHMNFQIFGNATSKGQPASMSGFLEDYSTTLAGLASAGQIMQSFGPLEAPVINTLAKQFAVCDAWFASAPCQTWPNRGFVHTGSSDGHINNDDYELYDIPTIFNILEEHHQSWGIFHDTTFWPSLTWGQFLPQLFLKLSHIYPYSIFKQKCAVADTAPATDKLPSYSFLEPRFMVEPNQDLSKLNYPNDYHPPHNILRGEAFLADLYQSIRLSPYRDKILLVITFDEHGGCYDHQPPPDNASAPQPGSISRDGTFDFKRFGVRVPTIVVSSYISPHTVFRAPSSSAPYDHTSILSTIKSWLLPHLDTAQFLPSPRISKAPTLEPILTLSPKNRNQDWPDIPFFPPDYGDESLDTPLTDLQKSLVTTLLRKKSTDPLNHQIGVQAMAQSKSLQTYRHVLQLLHPEKDWSSFK
jgi:phospholipase C